MAGEQPLITIVGCGPGSPDYVTPAAIKAIAQADVLVGAQRLLDLFPEHRGERILVDTEIGAVLDRVDEAPASKKIAVLVTGDPGLFSLSKRVIERFGRSALSGHSGHQFGSGGLCAPGTGLGGRSRDQRA